MGSCHPKRARRRPPTALRLEQLEDRLTPSTISFSNGVLSIADPSNGNDHVKIAPAANGGVTVRSNLGSGAFGPAVTEIDLNLGNGNENVQIDSLPGVVVSVTAGDGNNELEFGNEAVIDVTVGGGNNEIETGAGLVTVSVNGGGDNTIDLGAGVNNVFVSGGGDNQHHGRQPRDFIQVVGDGNNHIKDTGTDGKVVVIGNGNNNIHISSTDTATIDGSGRNDIDIIHDHDHDQTTIATKQTLSDSPTSLSPLPA